MNEGLITAALWRAAQACSSGAAISGWLARVEQAARDITGARLVLVTAADDDQTIITSSADLPPDESALLAGSLMQVLRIRDLSSATGRTERDRLFMLENANAARKGEDILLRELVPQLRLPPSAALIAPLRATDGQIVGLILTQGIETHRVLGVKRMQALQVLAFQTTLSIEGRHLRQRSDTFCKRMEAIRYAVDHLAAPLELEAILESMVEAAEQVFGADGASIYLGQREGVRCAASRGISKAYLQRAEQLGSESFWDTMRSTKGPIYFADLSTEAFDASHREMARQEGIRSMVLVPLIWEDTIFGGFAIYHRSVRPYSYDEMELAQTFTEHAAVAVHRARIYKAAQRTRSNLEAVINSMSDGLLVYDRQGVIILANPRLYDMFGLDKSAKLEHSHIRDFARLAQTKGASTSATAVYIEPDSEPLARQHSIVELKHPEIRYLEVVNQPVMNRSNDLIGRAIFHHDITRERDSQRVKDEFLSMLSHELRTPLTSIKGYAQILLRRPVSRPESDVRALQAIDVQTDKMLRLIEDLLTVSRTEKGRIPLQLERMDPVGLVQSVVDHLGGISPRHEVVLEITGSIPRVSADSRRLRDVLINLVENAIKYSPDGGRVITQIANGSGEVTFSVTDFGIGIPESSWSRVFDEFYQLDSSNSRRFGGVGLGLHICKLIVEAHGGRIWVRSVPGEGSVFSFALPACAD